MEVNTSFNPIDAAVSGLRAQQENIKIISSNVANAQSTDNGSGTPYRRVEAVFETDENGGVKIADLVEDSTDFQKILKPGHPDADEQGYVTMPNVNVPVEMMNLNIATRTYQANAAVLKRYQQMVETTLELLK